MNALHLAADATPIKRGSGLGHRIMNSMEGVSSPRHRHDPTGTEDDQEDEVGISCQIHTRYYSSHIIYHPRINITEQHTLLLESSYITSPVYSIALPNNTQLPPINTQFYHLYALRTVAG